MTQHPLEALYVGAVRGGSVPRALRGPLMSIAVFVRELSRDQVHVRAGTLSYWSLVAIVPSLVLVAAVMQPFGGNDAVRAFLYSTLLAGPVSAVGAQLDAYLAEVDYTRLGVAGLVGVGFTASRIFFSVEEAYSSLWAVPVRRPLLVRVVIFYALFTLVPVMIAYGFHVSGQLRGGVDIGVLQRLAPIVLTAVAFTGAIKALPDTEVRWRPAMIGGGCSAVLFEVAKSGFGAYTDVLGTADAAVAVYGSLALFPIFLLWLYVLWWIVLFGVELAYVAQRLPDLLAAEERLHASDFGAAEPDGFFALGCLVVVVRQWAAGEGPIPEPAVTREVGGDPARVRAALELLAEVGFLASADTGWVPAAPPDRVTGREVVLRCRGRGGAAPFADLADELLGVPADRPVAELAAAG